MAAELIISVSGMRGIIGENLSPAIAAEYGCVFGTFLKGYEKNIAGKLKVCIGRDSRPSGQMLLSAVTSGLTAVGVDVIDLGIVTTPCVGIMLRYLGCAGGVVITASHNPIEYNGIKLLLSDGIAPSAQLAEKIRSSYFAKDFTLSGSVDCGRVSSNDETDRVHIDKIKAIVDCKKIASKGFKVVLDSVNGAGGRIGVQLLEELGCEVVAMNNEPTGIFAHTPEPTEANLVTLCQKVRETGAAAGFAQDPDADRLAIVDGNGKYIGEEYTLALVGKHVLSTHKGKAAANLSTSRMIDDVAAQAGCEVIRTAVGEANVANAMKEQGCVIGGEGNGGVIDLRVGPVRDSQVGMALVLDLMAQSGNSIAELVGQIGGYSIGKDKYQATREQAQQIIDKAKIIFADAKLSTVDGARFDFEDGWVHLRSSNTEPVMRMIVEAPDEQTVKKYTDKIMAIRKEILG